MDKYKVCIVGCGDIGFQFDHGRKTDGALTHFKAFMRNENFIVSGIAEKRAEIRNLISDSYGVKSFEDHAKMFSEIRPEVIVIASDDETHYKILSDALEFEPEIVFCEKPLTKKFDEAERIISQYDKSGIALQVNFTRRFLDEFYSIEKDLKSNKLGILESITFYYQRGLVHNASHYLDLMNWYIGETEKNIIKVSAKEGLASDDETISFDMLYDKGLEVRFIGLNSTKLSFAEVDFIGTEGRIKLNYKNEIEKFRVVENKIFKGYSSYQLYESMSIRYDMALPNAVENIYGFLKGREELKSPAVNSLKVFELINRVKEKEICRS